VISFCAAYVGLHFVREAEWYREWLYRQLVRGDDRQALRAASELAALGAERQLLSSLKAESPAAREYGRRGLDYLWFHRAGSDAYHLAQAAYEAADKEDYATALELLNRTVEQYPGFAEAWNRRASVHWSLGLIQKSAADSERALALNPNHYAAWQGLGLCRLEQGDVTEAIRCLRAALRIVPYDQPTRDSLRRCEELQRTCLPLGRRALSADVI
jgi:tetratricopeptide (TPR) repeat protein